jgi:hypothetical protein
MGSPRRRGLSPWSSLIGLAGLVVLATVWLSHVRSGNLDCGPVVTSWFSATARADPCRALLVHRFTLGLFVAWPVIAAGWIVQVWWVGYLGSRRVVPRGSPQVTLRVSGRIRRARASYPLMRMTASPEQMVVVCPLAMEVVDRTEVAAVVPSDRRWTRGWSLSMPGRPSNQIVFSSPRGDQQLLSQLRDLGWPVA